MLTIGALVAAGIWAPEVLAWRTEPTRGTELEVAKPATEEAATGEAAAGATASGAATPGATTPGATTPDVPTPEAAGQPLLAEPGEVPASGTGSFVGAPERGPLLGGATGRFKRVRVAVESNLTAELDGLTAAVDTTLGDPRSWVAGGAYRFQRVPYSAPHDFTIYLVTRETAYRMCRINGVDIRVDGVPYTSCRQIGKVVINLDRWRLSVPSYVDNRISLALYRSYVINHEVGHELGRGHVGCPAAGRQAPVMLTQTLGLQGCAPNPWPNPDAT